VPVAGEDSRMVVSMHLLRAISLLLIFTLCAFGATTRNAMSLLLLCAIGAVLMALLLMSLFRQIPGFAHWTAAVAALLFICSGAGSFATCSLGIAGFIAIHLLIFAAYGTSLFLLLRRVSLEERVEESFMKFDFWALNLGLLAFAFIWLLDTMQANMQWAGVLSGFRRGLYPLSVLVMYLLVARPLQPLPEPTPDSALLSRAASSERLLALVLAIFIILSVAGGSMRLG
jgi:hypothetical protein